MKQRKVLVGLTVMIALLVLAIVRGKYGILAEDFSRDATIMMGIVIAVAYWALADHLWAHIAVFRKSATTDAGPSE